MTSILKPAESLELVSTQSTKAILELVIPDLEAQLGLRIAARFVGVSILKRTGTRGITADVFVGPREVVDQYAEEREPASTVRRHIAMSRSGAAFKTGAAIPDIGTSSGFLDVLRAATAVAYSDGISSEHLAQVLQRYGMDDSVASKRITPAPGGSAATPVALGLADVGVQQISEMISVRGITIVELPEEFRRTAAYDAVAIDRGERRSEIAAVMRFFTSDRFQGALAGLGLSSVQDCAVR